MSKMKKLEIVAIAVAMVILSFTIGYFAGRNSAPSQVVIDPEIDTELLSSDTEESADGKVNINTADRDELMTLPGIGEVIAEGIIVYREENGPFEKIEDIVNVSGIGDATFLKLRDYITVLS